jgi:hypothetical protein
MQVTKVSRLYSALMDQMLRLPPNPLRDQALDLLRTSGILMKEGLNVYGKAEEEN